jgi:hypothetical protein
MDKFYQISILETCRDKLAVAHLACDGNADVAGGSLVGVDDLLFEVLADLGTVIDNLRRR